MTDGNGEIKKKIYDMSKDEQESWELKKEEHDEPFRQATIAIDAGISMVLKAMGVDTEVDDDKIQAQMMSLGIFIKEYSNQPDVAPQIQGFYIFQMRFASVMSTIKEPVPIAFVGNPGVDSTGQICVQVQWFDKTTMEIVKGPKLKVAK